MQQLPISLGMELIINYYLKEASDIFYQVSKYNYGKVYAGWHRSGVVWTTSFLHFGNHHVNIAACFWIKFDRSSDGSGKRFNAFLYH